MDWNAWTVLNVNCISRIGIRVGTSHSLCLAFASCTCGRKQEKWDVRVLAIWWKRYTANFKEKPYLVFKMYFFFFRWGNTWPAHSRRRVERALRCAVIESRSCRTHIVSYRDRVVTVSWTLRVTRWPADCDVCNRPVCYVTVIPSVASYS